MNEVSAHLKEQCFTLFWMNSVSHYLCWQCLSFTLYDWMIDISQLDAHHVMPVNSVSHVSRTMLHLWVTAMSHHLTESMKSVHNLQMSSIWHNLVNTVSATQSISHCLVNTVSATQSISHCLVNTVSVTQSIWHNLVNTVSVTQSISHYLVNTVSITQGISHYLVNTVSITQYITKFHLYM